MRTSADALANVPVDGGAAPPSLYAIEAALSGALAEWGRHICEHENTHRGGAIWTICDDCGSKWDDDRGGFQPFKEPARITTAYSVLSRVRAALARSPASGAFPTAHPEVLPGIVQGQMNENSSCPSGSKEERK